MKQRYIIIFLIVFIVLQCSKKKENSKENLKTSDTQVIVLNKTSSNLTLSLLGSVTPKNKAEVSSKIIGRIEKLYFDEGDRIKKGAILAKVETLNLEIQLRKDNASLEVQNKQIDIAKARLQLAKQKVEKDLVAIQKAEAELKDSLANLNNLKRTYLNKKQLFEIGGVSESELKAVETALVTAETNYYKSQKTLDTLKIGFRVEDVRKANIPVGKSKKDINEGIIKLNTLMEEAELQMAIANLKATKANIESTKLLINESTLRSPIEGIIATRNLFQGESVKEGDPVFIIVDESEVYISFPVNESDLNLIKPGESITFKIDAIKDQEFVGKIHIVSPVLDPQSRSASIRVLFKNNQRQLKPGMFARADYIINKEEKNYVLPSDAVLFSKDNTLGTVFFLNEKNLAFKKQIEIIETLEDKVKISVDLPEGTRLLKGNLQSITEGESIDLD